MAAMAHLRLYYTARISGLMLVARGDPAAALSALVNERDAALSALRLSMSARALTRQRKRKRRYRVAIPLPERWACQETGKLCLRRPSARAAPEPT
jgi:hypothetical protein